MAVERRDRILAMINMRGMVSLKELEQTFPNVSSMTLRRDLQLLDDQGDLIRVRRGAKAICSKDCCDTEPVYTMRSVDNPLAKEAIASAALPFIEPSRTIYLDAGSTVMALARRIPNIPCTIITHAPNIAMEIAKKPCPDLYVLGGHLNKDNFALAGHSAITMLDPFNIDIAILCPGGYTPNVGFTLGDQEECELKRTIIAKARKTILLIDQTKLDRSLPLTFAKLSDIDTLLIDSPLLQPNVQAQVDDISKENIRILLCGKEHYHAYKSS